MVVETKQLNDKTVFSIDEPHRYGEPDKFREIIIPHNSEYKSQLPSIKKERIENPRQDKDYYEEIQTFEVPEIGTIVFIKNFDTDSSSATYRKGAHTIEGPYILVDS